MPRLAIISSYNDNCGNASYTHVLRTAFEEHMEVEVLGLDLFLIQKPGKEFRKHADNHIKKIAARLKEFDYVNIQFEAGLYGASIPDIRRRIGWLIDAASNLIFTMHRLDPKSRSAFAIITNAIEKMSPNYYFRGMHQLAYEQLYFDVVKMCKTASERKNVWIAVHTKRERRIVQEMYNFQNCFDYPLAFLTNEQREAAKAHNDVAAFKAKHGFPADKKVVGLFGYISAYKGIETVVRAMAHLPDDYVLALFGSQHPQTIEPNVEIDSYLKGLIEYMTKLSDETSARRAAAAKGAPPPVSAGTKEKDKETARESAREPDTEAEFVRTFSPHFDLLERVHFVGNLPDPEFIEALHLCDAVVLPYLEVGQSMSGVIVLALESDARMFCSNNLSFFEARKYYGDVYHTFDIGNSLELAQKIVAGQKDFSEAREAAYKKYNVRNAVNLQLQKFGHTTGVQA